MKVLIVEDETAASENLIAMLQEIDNSIEILHVLESVQQTVCWLETNLSPDLIFMDIHLSDGSAFSLFEQIDVQTPIIFTTAYDQYAINAFSVNSIDYLLKPIKNSDLIRALDKFKRLNSKDMLGYINKLMSLNLQNQKQEFSNTLLVPVKDKLLPINVEELHCIYCKDRNTQIFVKDGRTFAYNRSLDSIINTLDTSKFFRANKQFIVSRESVSEIVIWFDSRLLVKLPIETPEPIFVSKNKAAEFKNWMMK